MVFDKVSKKKATACTPDAAKVEVTVQKTIDPVTKKESFLASDGYDASADDDVHKCDDVSPTITTIKKEGNKITASVTQGTHPLQSVEFKVGDQVVGTAQISSAGEVSVAYNGSGTQTVTVTITDTSLRSGTLSKSINF